MLRFSQLALRRGSKLLFRDANFIIPAGQRVGITGANGCGKSSLFALIRGELHPDSGDFSLPADWVLAQVRQETPNSEGRALDFVIDGDQPLRQIQQALLAAEQADDGHRLAELHTALDHAGGYQAQSRAASLLHGLGFGPGEEWRPVNSFSGGWRMRLNLAQALMCRSDLLLLDEPTNHLDLEAVIWLESWLRAYPGTLLLISHDRDFLDAVIGQVAQIEQQRVTLYPGNYSAFERIRAEQLAQQQAAYDSQQRERAHIRAFVDRFRAKATKARQAQSRLKALERMELIAPAHVDSAFHFEFRPPEGLPNPLLTLERARLGHGDREVLYCERLVLDNSARIGLLGQNGAGKSTLIRTLAGELPLLDGLRTAARTINIGYFAQHQLDQLRPDRTPLQHLSPLDPSASEQQLRDYLGGFGFGGDQAASPVAPFSGGEKARLVLALIVYRRPNLLLLDEPTNHLDLEMRQALALALQEFEGAMILVSHDRHLLRSTADQLWLVHQGRVEEFSDSLDDYPAWLARQQAESSVPPASASEQSAQARKERKRQQAAQRQQLQPLTRRIAELEALLESLGQRRQALQDRLGDSNLYLEQAKPELMGLLAEQARLDRQIESTEEEWLAQQELLEELRRDGV